MAVAEFPSAALTRLRETFAYHLAVKFNLCCALEDVADRLPDLAVARSAMPLVRSIAPILARAHAFEEGAVYPYLRRTRPDDDDLLASLQRLEAEHCEDDSFAGELHAAFTGVLCGEHGIGPNALSYMLRGFFETLRRHIAFEREHILPMIRPARGAA